MISKKEKRLKRIKRHGGFGGILILSIITFLMVIALYMFISSFVYYALGTKGIPEYEYFLEVFDRFDKVTDKNEAVKILKEADRIIIVKDKNGQPRYKTGTDTIGEKNGMVSFYMVDYNSIPEDGYFYDGSEPGVEINVSRTDDIQREVNVAVGSQVTSSSVMAYVDREMPFVVPYNGQIALDEKAFFKWLKNSDDRYFVDVMTNRKNVELPVWLAKETSEGTMFYCRCIFSISGHDLEFFLILISGLAILYFAIFIMILVHITGQFKTQRRLNAVIYTDEVTGGRNFMWFLIKGGQFLRRHKNDKYNYAVLDLVFVGYQNFCMCHSVADGEKLLTKVDMIVKKNLDKRKEAIAHYASSSFAVLLRYGDEEELKSRIQFLLEELGKVDTGHNFNFHVGVKTMPSKTDKKGRLVRRKKILDLDQEYINACTAGATLEDNDSSGVAFFDDKLLEEQKWLDQVQEEQRKALDNEEFLVYYQPKYDPTTDTLKGAEALIRWESPKYGFLSPGRFIPIFEKNGFITEIDHYMIQHVARDQKRWMDEGKKCVPVSVNVSRAHFIESDLAEQIRDMVDSEGAPHELIEIELTESAFFDDKNAIIRTIGKLKEFGFMVSMDDFGSGYSSLNSLKDMPLDVLKLDADFFRGDGAGERGQIVVSEAIKLAKKLEMRTVAEGVEIKEQVEFLADQGCDMIQGFYYAKPMPGNEYESRMPSAGQTGENDDVKGNEPASKSEQQEELSQDKEEQDGNKVQ